MNQPGIRNENPGLLDPSEKRGAPRTLPLLVVSCANSRVEVASHEIEKQPQKTSDRTRKPLKIAKKSTRKVIALPALEQVEDIDEGDEDYLEFCQTYVKKIYDYLFEIEEQYYVEPDYLKKHPNLRPKMRALLIQWMVSLQVRYKLLQDTLLLSVSLLDRFLTLTKTRMTTSRFQLLGAACLWLACKYEEIYLPSVKDFVFMGDGAYTTMDLRQMEIQLLNTLEFKFAKPMTVHFLRRFSKAGGGHVRTHTVAKYLLEVSCYCYELVHYKPSMIAASAIYIAGKLTGEVKWDETMSFYTRYSSEELKTQVEILLRMATEASDNPMLRTTVKKFSSGKLHSVASLFKDEGLLRNFSS